MHTSTHMHNTFPCNMDTYHAFSCTYPITNNTNIHTHIITCIPSTFTNNSITHSRIQAYICVCVCVCVCKSIKTHLTLYKISHACKFTERRKEITMIGEARLEMGGRVSGSRKQGGDRRGNGVCQRGKAVCSRSPAVPQEGK